MSFIDLVVLAASNLWRRKLRTILTVLGVIIGTACIVIMVALGLGNLEQFNQSIMQNTDLTQIQVYQRGNDPNMKFTDAKLNEFRAIPNVKSVTGTINIPSYILMGKYEYDGAITAADPEAMGLEVQEGKLFSNSPNLEFVVGANARQFFVDPNDRTGGMDGMFIGGAISVGGEEEYVTPTGPDVDWAGLTVKYYPAGGYIINAEDGEGDPDTPKPSQYQAVITGVLKQAEDQNSYSVFMSLEAANKLIRENRKVMQNAGVKEGEYQNVYVNAMDVDSVQGILDVLKSSGYEVYSPTEWITQMQTEQARQQSQLVAIGLISLVVSAIGIANTMLASILERAREIGVMKVIGLSIGKINLMFLIEAAMIGLFGGLVGLGISFAAAGFTSLTGGSVSLFGMYFDNGISLLIPWWLSLGAIGIAVTVGIVSGIYPAWKATKMSPLEAIRSSN